MNRPRQHKYANPLPRVGVRAVLYILFKLINSEYAVLGWLAICILYLGHLLLGVPSVHMKNRLSIFVRCFVSHRCDKHVHVVTLLRRVNFVRQGKRRRNNEDESISPEKLAKTLEQSLSVHTHF